METEDCFTFLSDVCSLPSTMRAIWEEKMRKPALHQACIYGKALPAERSDLLWVSASHQHGFDLVLQTASFQIPDSLEQLQS